MLREERSVSDGIQDFCEDSPEVFLIALEGAVNPANESAFKVALYPRKRIAFNTSSDTPLNSHSIGIMHEAIFRLKVDEALGEISEISDNSQIRQMNEVQSLLTKNPIAVFDIGLNRETKKHYVLLHVIPGLSPKTAVQEIQEALRSALPGY